MLVAVISLGHAASAGAANESILDLMAKVEAAVNAGNTAEADKLMDNALATLRQEAGADHPSVGMALTNQGKLRLNTRRFAEAATSFADATAVFEKSLGRENPIAFSTRYQWLVAARQAGNAAAAAEVARHLLDSLTTLAGSGRAAKAGWGDVLVAPNQPMKLPVTPDDAGIAEVESILGLCLADAGKPTEAAPVLASALARIERLYGQGHPRGVAVQQAIEKIALARGEAIGRRHVGDLAMTRNLKFEGNTGFAATDLIHGLACDAGVVLASHPAGSFAGFLDAIQRALQRGYRAAGYPDARVAMRYTTAPDTPACIIASVTEGPRYRTGTVRVTGAPPEIADGLVRTLTITTPQQANSLQQRIDAEIAAAGATMATDENQDQANPSASGPATRAATGAATGTLQPVEMPMTSSSVNTAIWTADQPVDFEYLTDAMIKGTIQAKLAQSGHPMARWNQQIVRLPDGCCDLVIAIDDIGPAAVVGSIKITGNRRNTAEKITDLVKLKPGDPLLPENLAAVRMALWNSGRFWPFSVRTVAADAAREVDVVIAVNELEKAPALDVEPTDIQAAALRAARVANEAFASRGFLLAGEKDGVKFDLALDPGGTIAAKLSLQEGGRDILVGMDNGLMRVVTRDKSGTTAFSLPIGSKGITGIVKILPSRQFEKDWDVALSFAFSFATGSAGDAGTGAFMLNMLISPTFAYLTDLDLAIKDGTLIASSKGSVQFTADAVTGKLVSIAGYPVIMGDATTKGLLKELDEVIMTDGSKNTALAWSDLLARGLGIAFRDMHAAEATGKPRQKPPGAKGVSVAVGSFVCNWLPSLRDLSPRQIEATERIVARMLRGIVAGHEDAGVEKSSFHVPVDSTQGQNLTMPILLGLGFIQLSEAAFPPDTWMSTLSREMLFSLAGNHRYTSTTIDSLLADPEMGPLGSLLAARMIDFVMPGKVRMFEEKALRQCTADGFRRDWELATRGDSSLAKMITGMFDALAALTPAEEADILLLLGPDRAAWFRDLLVALRSRPPGGKLADCIAPHMDALWTNHLGPMMSKSLDTRLHPPVDPTRVAAVVNGKPAPRALVNFIERLSCPMPGNDDSKPAADTWEQARQDLIRLMLVREEYLANGGTIDPAAVEKIFLGIIPKSFGSGDDATMQKACGITRAEALLYIEMRAAFEVRAKIKLAAPEPPSAGEIARWQSGPGAGLFDEFHVHWWKTSGPDDSLFSGQAKAADRLHALRALLAHGISNEILYDAGAKDRCSVVEFQCQKALPNYGMQPALGTAMATIAPDGFSQPIISGGRYYLLLPVSRKPGKAPDDKTAASIIAARFAHVRQNQTLGTWLADLEKHADIKIIEGPRPDAKTWIAASNRIAETWKTEDPGSLIARLITFWCAVHTKDDAATNRAMADLTRAPTLDAASLIKLADAVAKTGDELHAKQLRDKAATLPKPGPAQE